MCGDLFFLRAERFKGPAQGGALASLDHLGCRFTHLSAPPPSAYAFCPHGHRSVPAPLGFVLQVLGEKKTVEP